MSCPSSDNLTQLARGTLDDERVEQIERHLSECDSCRISLVKIEASLDDPLSKRLHKSKKADDSKEASFEHIKIPGFRIIKQIGSGGMGTVYEAVDESSGEIRAVKVLHSSRHFDQNAVARFQREKEVIAKLQHPTIVKSFPYNSDKRTSLCIVMERLKGMDLGEFVKQHGPLSLDQARDFIIQAANGLHFAHANGIVHRDIKPSNLFVTELGSIKILDLGLARLSETENETTNTLTDQIVGTPDFISPEQAVSPKLLDRRSDIYSLGCTFFYLLTGKAPFDNEKTVGGKIAAHARDIAPNIRKIRPDVSSELASILKKMLEKKPEKRFQTAAEVANALIAKTSSGVFSRFWLVLSVAVLSLVGIMTVLLSSQNDLTKDGFDPAPAPISFSPALQVSPADVPIQDRKIRITFELDENGKATYRLENQADAKPIPFNGEPFEIPGHPKTKAKRNSEGIVQLQYDFADFDPNDPYLGCNFDYSIEPPYIVFKNGNKGNIITYAKTLPIFFQADIDHWSGSPACFVVEEVTRNIMPDPLGLSNHLQQTPSNGYSFISSFRKHGEGEHWLSLFPEEMTSLRLPYEKHYQLPDDVRFEKPLQFHLCQPEGEHLPRGDMKIRRAEFRGKFIEKEAAWHEVELLKLKPRYYRVEGKRLLGPDGKTAFIRGFNVKASMKPTPQDVQELKQIGVKYVRYIFTFDFTDDQFDPKDIEPLRKYGKTFKEQIELFTNEGIDVIVSPISAKAGYNPWSDESKDIAFVKLWQHVTEVLKENPHILGWDINNSPDHWDELTVVNSWHEKTVRMIRESDPHRPIFITAWKHGDFRSMGSYMIVSDRNVVYQFYPYFTFEPWTTTEFLIDKMKPIHEFQERYDVPVLAVDWWIPNRPENVQSIKMMATALERMRLPWTNNLWFDSKNDPQSSGSTELLREFINHRTFDLPTIPNMSVFGK